MSATEVHSRCRDAAVGRSTCTSRSTSFPCPTSTEFLLTTAQYDASAISQMSFQAAASIMSSGPTQSPVTLKRPPATWSPTSAP